MTSSRSEGVQIIGREAAEAMGGIGFVDSSLCAAHVALWNGAVATDLMFPSLDLLDAVGFRAVDLLDPEISILLARRGDNPLRFVRVAARRLTRTPLNVWVNARCLLGRAPLEASLIELGIAQLAECGVRRVTCFDAVNDVRAMEAVARHCGKSGIAVSTALVYQASSQHDERYYGDRARALVDLQAESIVAVDFAGGLTPETTRALVAAIKQAAGTTPIEFRTYCRSGVAEMSCFEALSAGASVLHTASDALSGGWSLPSTGYFVEHLARRHVPVRINRRRLAALDEYYAALATHEGLPRGEHKLPDTTAERYQIPVALLRQCDEAAATAGLAVDALCEACLAVQKDMGMPTLAHPLGSVVVAQAVLYASGGRAYPTVIPDVAAFANGAFGTPPASLSNTLRQRTSKSSPATSGAPALSSGSDEERVLASWFPGIELAPSIASGPEPVRATTPQQYLKERLEREPALQSIRVQKGGVLFELDRAASGRATK